LPKRAVQAKVRLVSLDELLSRSDFLSIHLPLDETTTGMIGKEELTRLKRGAFLIHTARGGIVDEQALLHALQSEHLAGAALDVFSREPPELESLLKNPHVVLTPHIGAQTREAQRRTSIDIATEVLAALNEEPLRWQIH
jgi:D-3-phosphoglycerate dehydrogenase